MAHRTVSAPTRVPALRRRLEAAGWRTWLAYRENHERDAHGRLCRIAGVWVAEAEHPDGRAVVCEATSPALAWWELAAHLRRTATPHTLAG